MKVLETAFRIYCRHEELDVQIAFYERLQGTTCARRIRISETGVTAAKVGSVLVLAGDEAVLGPVRHVTAIFWVEALDELLAWLAAEGASLVNGPRTVVGGRNATVRHPDGLVVEYFEAASSVVQEGRWAKVRLSPGRPSSKPRVQRKRHGRSEGDHRGARRDQVGRGGDLDTAAKVVSVSGLTDPTILARTRATSPSGTPSSRAARSLRRLPRRHRHPRCPHRRLNSWLNRAAASGSEGSANVASTTRREAAPSKSLVL